jgi:hypothetical protein
MGVDDLSAPIFFVNVGCMYKAKLKYKPSYKNQ